MDPGRFSFNQESDFVNDLHTQIVDLRHKLATLGDEVAKRDTLLDKEREKVAALNIEILRVRLAMEKEAQIQADTQMKHVQALLSDAERERDWYREGVDQLQLQLKKSKAMNGDLVELLAQILVEGANENLCSTTNQIPGALHTCQIERYGARTIETASNYAALLSSILNASSLLQPSTSFSGWALLNMQVYVFRRESGNWPYVPAELHVPTPELSATATIHGGWASAPCLFAPSVVTNPRDTKSTAFTPSLEELPWAREQGTQRKSRFASGTTRDRTESPGAKAHLPTSSQGSRILNERKWLRLEDQVRRLESKLRKAERREAANAIRLVDLASENQKVREELQDTLEEVEEAVDRARILQQERDQYHAWWINEVKFSQSLLHGPSDTRAGCFDGIMCPEVKHLPNHTFPSPTGEVNPPAPVITSPTRKRCREADSLRNGHTALLGTQRLSLGVYGQLVDEIEVGFTTNGYRASEIYLSELMQAASSEAWVADIALYT
ncbi:hypothetical protein BKA70DRAFT_1228078 [Coprinopsis sp. MPI-PUGE-AT-0042]|nr:hypothetical protein BKA70DRAFT_1228078 [Coprinopsis sp. MPI-PUGE-AT-0042]